MIQEMDGLNSEEQAKLSQALRDASTDNPRTELGVSRIKKFASKAGQAIGGGFYKIAVDVLSDAAKKSLLGP